MIPEVKAKLLEGKKGLIVGIANENSIAWGCAKAFRAFGAELAVTYLNEKAKKYVEPLARELEAPIVMPLDVNIPGQMEAVFERITNDWATSTSSSIPSPFLQRRRCGTFWPLWLAEDVKGLAVYSLGYVSPPTNWIGTAMPLLDEAALALRVLRNSEDLKTGPISRQQAGIA
jgi:NAD(P)-dependent dehydrogenase (short-subunit alcohol dehydrogenase family)